MDCSIIEFCHLCLISTLFLKDDIQPLWYQKKAGTNVSTLSLMHFDLHHHSSLFTCGPPTAIKQKHPNAPNLTHWYASIS